MKIITETELAKEYKQLVLQKKIGKKDSKLKKYMVEYVGKKLNKKDITVEDIVEIMTEEFPEFLLLISEENYLRGYNQGIEDTRELFNYEKG